MTYTTDELKDMAYCPKCGAALPFPQSTGYAMGHDETVVASCDHCDWLETATDNSRCPAHNGEFCPAHSS